MSVFVDKVYIKKKLILISIKSLTTEGDLMRSICGIDESGSEL